ncbi:ion channel [Lysobacter sp. 2RAF19]
MHEVLRFSLWRMLARRHPSAFLLAAQLLSLLLYPLMDDSNEGRMLFGGVAVVIVPLAVWTVSRGPALNILAWLLAVPSLLLTLWICWFDDMRLLPLAASLEALLYFYAAAGLILYMMRDTRVSSDELFAAGATFTLIAWGFAYAYFVCQAWYPGSFTGIDPDRERTWLELLFFSISNLSATGLGDVLPVTAPARVLTMLEQIAGVGYIATVVSRLIGLTIIQQQK